MSARPVADIWYHFNKPQKISGKATCNYCNKLVGRSAASTTAMMKHLKTKHPKVLISKPSKLGSRSRSPSTSELERTDSEVIERSFSPNFKEEQACSSLSASVLFSSPLPSSSTSMRENQKNRLSNFVSILSPPSIHPGPQHPKMSKVVDIIKPVHLSKSLAIDLQLTKMICKEFHTSSIVEDAEFKKLLKMAFPGYNLPSRKTIFQSLVPSLYLSSSEKLKTNLELTTAICITIDSWTSVNDVSFYAITAHYLDKESKLNSNMIDSLDFSVEHTPIDIAEWLDSKLKKWNVRKKIAAAVTDNSPNIKSAIKTLNIHHIACYAHTLNLIVQSSIKVNINDVVRKIKEIVQYFKRNSNAMAKLEDVQKGMNKPVLKLKLEVPTRWNSTFDMLRQALANKEPIILTLALLRGNDTCNLDWREWEIVEESVKVLGIFEEVTKEISSEKIVFLSKACVLSRTLVRHVKQMSSTKSKLPDEVKGLLNSLLDGLKNKFMDMESLEVVSQSIFLDPRFKKTGFGNEKKFKDTYSTIAKKIRQMGAPQSSREMLPLESQTTNCSLWEEYDKTFEMLKATSDPSAPVIVEMDKYEAEPLLHRTCDPLKWWQEKKHLYPNLYEIAKWNLCIPASSVPCESIFTKAGQTLHNRRTLLTSSEVNQLLFLNSNWE